MSFIHLRGKIISIKQKSGFLYHKPEKRYEDAHTLANPHGKIKVATVDTTALVAGGVYITFECGCGKRNKRPLKALRKQTERTVEFLCNGCSNIVELPLMLKRADPQPVEKRTERGIILP